jgi:two-component system, OmpR family, sensor histidine kinase KdpD
MKERDEDDSDRRAKPPRQTGQRSEDASDLLKAMSHDFATPLANIKLAAEVLMSGAGRISEEKLVGLGRNMSAEADRLRRMIDTLIEWNRLQISQRPLSLKWHLAEDLIGSALRGLQSLLDDQKVVVTIEPDLAFVLGDELLLERVLINLIDNAAYCTPRGDKIEINAHADETSCTVEVIDTGPPLERDEDVAVDAHASARTGQSGPPGGGLGLVVSRMIIEAHGGKIWARNRTDESGAVFGFVLGYGGESPPHAPMEAK